MSTFAERLILLIKAEKMSVNKFAKEAKISHQKLQNIVDDKFKPSFDTSIKILQRFDYVNYRWFFTGIGEPKTPHLEDQIISLNRKIEELKEENIKMKLIMDEYKIKASF